MVLNLPFLRRRGGSRRIPILTYHSLNAQSRDYASNDHIALEEEREEELLRLSREQSGPSSRLGKVVEVSAVFVVFTIIMFTVMYFIG